MRGACRPSSPCRCMRATGPCLFQLIVRTPKGGNKPTPLPHGTSLFDVRNAMPNDNEIVDRDSLRLFSVPAALVAVSEQCFRRTSTDVRAAMAIVKDASDVLTLLLEGGHSTVRRPPGWGVPKRRAHAHC